LTSSSIISG